MKNQPTAPEAHTKGSTQKLKAGVEGAFSLLMPEIQRAIADEGYQTPSPIQEHCIEHLLNGKDIIGSAQTGTGKTAAFTLPLLQKLVQHPIPLRRGNPRALILAPTRELAAQIGESVQTYSKYLRISHTVIFGGVSQFHQVKALNRGCDILVATPGRLLDLVNQKHIHLDKVEVFILDEVDRMLDMGFIHDIRRVLKHIPKKRQTMFFSATMPPKMEQLALTMVSYPERITIEPDKPAVERINQRVLFVNKPNKDKLLADLLRKQEVKKTIIFTQMKHAANRVVQKLEAAGVQSAAIHGNKSQGARTKALDGFKRGKFDVLVATDVAARGIDVDDITHVINYDLPVEAETYVHRIGRTARAGTDGEAISFCSAEERAYLKEIEKLLGRAVPAEMEHAYHCETAFKSTQPAPKNFGRGGGGGKPGRSNTHRSGGGGHPGARAKKNTFRPKGKNFRPRGNR